MLVLTRKMDEAICIGNSIRVTVVDIGGNKVRLGIDAPSDVRIHRGELLARGVRDFVDLASADELDEPAYCI